MSVEFKLPNLGEGVESADVAEILVKEGDVIEANQPVVELETEKAVMEVPCPHAGTISKLHIAEGDTLSVGQVLLTIEPSGDGATAQKSSGGASSQETQKSAEPSEPKAEKSSAPAESPRKEPEPAGAEESGGAEEVVDFELPNLGEGVETADVAEVLVSEGDQITAGQSVLELETEKAVMEAPCPHAGTIEKLLVKAGDTIKVGQPVLRIRTSGAAKSAPAKPAAGRSAEAPAKPAAESKPREREAIAEVQRATGTHLISRADEPKEDSSNGHPPAPAAPSTRRLARKLGVNLRDVRGTGPGGRITHENVEDHVRGLLERKQVPAVARGGGGLAGGSLAPPPLPDFSRFGPVDREAMNKIARTAAENLTVSWNVIPHVTQHDRADITDLEAARKRFGAGLGKNGPKVTMTAVAMKALATCLQAYPKFNSSLDPETNELVYKRYYHIGCAVDTPNGLLVPVVKDCDKKSILDIAASITELAEKARDRKLSMDSMQGATCTVTNLGGIGGTAFTPIVNYPEVCILGMCRSQKELQLVDGQVSERLMLPLALSYDHRVINGADAARFMATLCQMLSDPFQLLSAI